MVTYTVLKKDHGVYVLAKYIFLYTSHELPFDKNKRKMIISKTKTKMAHRDI